VWDGLCEIGTERRTCKVEGRRLAGSVFKPRKLVLNRNESRNQLDWIELS